MKVSEIIRRNRKSVSKKNKETLPGKVGKQEFQHYAQVMFELLAKTANDKSQKLNDEYHFTTKTNRMVNEKVSEGVPEKQKLPVWNSNAREFFKNLL